MIVLRLRLFRYDPSRGRLHDWLITLARHTLADMARRPGRPRPESLDTRAEARLLGRDLDPATAYERRRIRELVRTVLRELREEVSDRSYQVLNLRRIEGRPVREIAARLNLTPEQVRVRDHRMRLRFRALFERHAGSGHAKGG